MADLGLAAGSSIAQLKADLPARDEVLEVSGDALAELIDAATAAHAAAVADLQAQQSVDLLSVLRPDVSCSISLAPALWRCASRVVTI